MNKTLIAALVLIGTANICAAPDKRLATATTAFVEAADPLSDDRPVATCLADILEKTTALKVVADRMTADVVLVISKGSVSGGMMRSMGALGGAYITATTVAGEKLWGDVETITHTYANRFERSPEKQEIPCLVADALAGDLRKGMRKARDAKR